MYRLKKKRSKRIIRFTSYIRRTWKFINLRRFSINDSNNWTNISPEARVIIVPLISFRISRLIFDNDRVNSIINLAEPPANRFELIIRQNETRYAHGVRGI